MGRIIGSVVVISGLVIASTVLLWFQMRDTATSAVLTRGLDVASGFVVAARAAPADDGVLTRVAQDLVTDAVTHACVYQPDGAPLCDQPNVGETAAKEVVAAVLDSGAYQVVETAGVVQLWYPVVRTAQAPALRPGPALDTRRVLLLALSAESADRAEQQTLLHAGLVFALLFGLVLSLRHQLKLLARERELEREAAAQRRFAAIGQLSAVLAHEIRNPLGAIKGFAQYTARRFDEDDPAKEDMDTIVTESTRLERLVESLLSYARPASLNRQWQDLRDVVASVVKLVEVDATENDVVVRVVEPADRLAAQVDADQLSQALLNLCSNAVQAMVETGGRLTVTIREWTDTSGRGGAELVVEDQGPGIDPSLKDTLFEPYVTGKARGTGLGLAVTKRIVVAHGGSIAAGDAVGGGAQFVVRLPTGTGVEE